MNDQVLIVPDLLSVNEDIGTKRKISFVKRKTGKAIVVYNFKRGEDESEIESVMGISYF
jgi:hypothetical protein